MKQGKICTTCIPRWIITEIEVYHFSIKLSWANGCVRCTAVPVHPPFSPISHTSLHSCHNSTVVTVGSSLLIYLLKLHHDRVKHEFASVREHVRSKYRALKNHNLPAQERVIIRLLWLNLHTSTQGIRASTRTEPSIRVYRLYSVILYNWLYSVINHVLFQSTYLLSVYSSCFFTDKKRGLPWTPTKPSCSSLLCVLKNTKIYMQYQQHRYASRNIFKVELVFIIYFNKSCMKVSS